MNVVDSGAWLEYFADGPNAAFFAPAIADTEKLVVPTLSLYEVFKRVLQQRNEDDALMAMATMQQGTVIDLDAGIALSATRISIDCKLPMADSVMLATVRTFETTLWTQDEHLKSLTCVKHRPARGYASGSK
jgi:toxin FitB